MQSKLVQDQASIIRLTLEISRKLLLTTGRMLSLNSGLPPNKFFKQGSKCRFRLGSCRQDFG